MGRRRFGGRKSIGGMVDEIYAWNRIRKFIDKPTDDPQEIYKKYELIQKIDPATRGKTDEEIHRDAKKKIEAYLDEIGRPYTKDGEGEPHWTEFWK